MGFLQDWFNGEAKKSYESATKRAAAFEEQLETHQKHMADERVFANMRPVEKKVPFADLPFHPVYEQRNKMYPHQIFTRRPAGDS
ncbi:hypothetical protein MNEG_8611 [Monoraphidium neglectum]|uniref:Uncharacterized protein n=1 Tax=Monoraphidium neglectum TaxID=145388 RepID=A0A0D2MF30_9CHLO|nr:hypothetical protein MNEG_8611 [Monoraphidium neglectum]KIY99351.1 hypothetical protein MNEG_8611 [Monoraphidium neglectum]|eukprot:XP_013898371.1 hypothetical protein MNEG_8611 [Monoraphidium neglectum]